MALADILAIDARDALRLLCGAFLLPHTVAKLRNIEKAAEFFAKIGFHPPRFFVVFTATMEAIAAIGLITNLYPRGGALMAAAILFVAAWAVVRVHGWNWRWQFGGPEYMLFWGIACLIAGFTA